MPGVSPECIFFGKLTSLVSLHRYWNVDKGKGNQRNGGNMLENKKKHKTTKERGEEEWSGLRIASICTPTRMNSITAVQNTQNIEANNTPKREKP